MFIGFRRIYILFIQEITYQLKIIELKLKIETGLLDTKCPKRHTLQNNL